MSACSPGPLAVSRPSRSRPIPPGQVSRPAADLLPLAQVQALLR